MVDDDGASAGQGGEKSQKFGKSTHLLATKVLWLGSHRISSLLFKTLSLHLDKSKGYQSMKGKRASLVIFQPAAFNTPNIFRPLHSSIR
jgi:hypothetical protein